MSLRPGTWRRRVSWGTHVRVARGFGLFRSGLAVVIAVALDIDARALFGAFTGRSPLWRVWA